MSRPKGSTLRRFERKELDVFYRDHCVGWRPPLRLRKIRYAKADLARLMEMKAFAVEDGRKRMVARGMTQYSHPGELCGCGSTEKELDCERCDACNVLIRRCPTCRTVITVPKGCTHCQQIKT